LEKLTQGYDFIRRLYDKVIIPPAVLEEVAVGQFASPSEYLQHYRLSDLIEVRPVSQLRVLPEAERLHEGETQAIQLAVESQLPLLIEETVGRRVAQGVGLQISHGKKRRAARVTMHASPWASEAALDLPANSGVRSLS
jgi:predicted nucleic acid-binding protein